MNTLRWLTRLSLFAAIFAWLVIGLGAFTRLTDAGLGCPDWPGCYGHMLVSNATVIMSKTKAWTEMLHRYFAGTLASLIFLTAIFCVLNAVRYGATYIVLAVAIFMLVIYQALLGMWTVTLKLWPIVVSQHLLGGMTILALLWFIYLKSKADTKIKSGTQLSHNDNRENKSHKVLAFLGVVFLFFQIALGAWTSTNYAALSCQSFPFCGSMSGWQINFHDAFSLFPKVGVNYEGGVLNEAARQTIQMTHRLGALLVTIYLGLMATLLLSRHQGLGLRRSVIVMLVLLVIQLGFGVSNVLFSLPLAVAVLHNLIAALLLCSVITVTFYLMREPAYGSV